VFGGCCATDCLCDDIVRICNAIAGGDVLEKHYYHFRHEPGLSLTPTLMAYVCPAAYFDKEGCFTDCGDEVFVAVEKELGFDVAELGGALDFGDGVDEAKVVAALEAHPAFVKNKTFSQYVEKLHEGETNG